MASPSKMAPQASVSGFEHGGAEIERLREKKRMLLVKRGDSLGARCGKESGGVPSLCES